MKRNSLSPFKRFLISICLSFGHAGAMTIFVNLPSSEQINLDVEPSDNIENIRTKIQDARAIVLEDQYLYYTGNLLEDGQTLADYGITNNGVLQAYVVGPLAGTSFNSYPALLNFSIRDAAATNGRGWMTLNYSGAADLSAMGLGSQTISLRSFSGTGQGFIAGFDPSQSYEWNFLSAPGGVTGFNAVMFTVDTTGFSNAFTGAFSVVQSSPQSLAIAYSAVPEPTAAMSGALGLLALAFRRKRI
jgi:Ubiquitin family